MTFDQAIELVRAERQRQDEKWGSQRHLKTLLWNAILAEEVGEVANAILENHDHESVGAPSKHIIAELVQVAAVAICWLESEDGP